MPLFLFIATSLILLITVCFYKNWSILPKTGQENSAEWLALVQKRDEIERDSQFSEDTKQLLRDEWAKTAETVLANPNAQPSEHKLIAQNLSPSLIKALTTAVILLAGAFYWSIGHMNQQALQWPSFSPVATNPMQMSAEPPPMDGAKHPGDMESLEQRIATLKEKLNENPKDLDRWVLLARSLGVQRDFVGSAQALRAALKLSPEHPDLLADLADTVAMVNNKSLLGESSELIAQALRADPKHPKALALAATAAMQKGDKKTALDYWQTLRALYPENSVDVARIDEIIQEINTRGLQRPQQVAEPVVENESPKNQQASISGEAISGEVSIDKKLLSILKAKDLSQAVLYVFAKMESGPPMPLAVFRSSPQALLKGEAMTFKLDDSLAMSPAMKLSNAEKVKLEARISLTGNAIKQAGDLSASATVVKVGTQGLHLVIEAVEK